MASKAATIDPELLKGIRIGDSIETMLTTMLGNESYDTLFNQQTMHDARARVVREAAKGVEITEWNRKRIELIETAHAVYGGVCAFCGSVKTDLMIPANLSMNMDNKNDICTRLKTWNYPLMIDGRPILLTCSACNADPRIYLMTTFVRGLFLINVRGRERNAYFRAQKQILNPKGTPNQHHLSLTPEEQKEMRERARQQTEELGAKAIATASKEQKGLDKRIRRRVFVATNKPDELELLAVLDCWSARSKLVMRHSERFGWQLGTVGAWPSRQKPFVPDIVTDDRIVDITLTNLRGPERGKFNRVAARRTGKAKAAKGAATR